MLRQIVNILLYFLPPSRLFYLRRQFYKLAKINLHEDVKLCGRSWVYGRGSLIIGDRTWISPGCNFFTHTEASIEIGADCDIGPNTNFIIGSHKLGCASRRAGKGIANSIKIGSGCWIGANVTIIDGVEISDGSVVAAGSIVISNVPRDVLVAGVPAVVKKEL